MKKHASLLNGMMIVLALTVMQSRGQPLTYTPYTFSALAGGFNSPSGLALDSAGNLYVADSQSSTIRKVTKEGMVTTLAGSAGSVGSLDGSGAGARFNYPLGVAVDGAGNVYVADAGNHTIRKVTANGIVTTLAGLAGSSGSMNGMGSAARFNSPEGVALDGAGNIYVADTANNTIRQITPLGTNWVVTTLAGQAGAAGNADGIGNVAQFNSPAGVAVSGAGFVYVADYNNCSIRKLTAAQTNWVVSTVAGGNSTASIDGTGTSAAIDYPASVAVDGAGNVYTTDTGNNLVRKVTPAGGVTTLGGQAEVSGSADGTGSAALFRDPYGVAADGVGNVYVSDRNNNTIRKGSPSPPFISLQPGSQTVVVGSAALFSVSAGGDPPLSYRWMDGTSPIADATNATLTLTNVQEVEAGDVSVVVSSPYGSVASSNAVLTVLTPDHGVYDLWADFSATNNPSGAWTFGWETTPGGAFTAYTNHQNAGPINAWDDFNNSGFFENPPLQPGSQFPPGACWLTPGLQPTFYANPNPPPDRYAAIRFSPPSGQAKVYTVTVSFSPYDGAGGASVILQTNGGWLFYQTLAGNQSLSITNQLSFQPGDTFDILLGAETLHGEDVYAYATMIVAATIDSVTSTNGAALPPLITTQPQNQTALAGTSATFGVTASSLPPLAYQWFYGTNTITGATNSALNLTNVQFAQAGNYSVEVSGPGGTVTSSNALLVVVPGTTTNLFDLAADFSITHNPNGPWTYGWQDSQGRFTILTSSESFNAVSGTASYDLNGWFNQGDYIAFSPTMPGALWCAGENPEPGTTVKDIVVERFTLPTGADGDYQVAITASPLPVQAYANAGLTISKNGQVILTESDDLGGTNNLISVTLLAGDTIDFAQATPFSQGVVFEAVLYQSNASPSFTAQPMNQTVILGGSASFSVTAVAPFPVSYQWMFGTTAVTGATNSTLNLTNVQYAQAGNYSVAASGPGGASVTSSNALLTVLSPAIPSIASQPANQIVTVGASATLAVVVTGSAPLSFQWYVGASGDSSSPIAGATNAVFTTAQLYSSASFWVAVQNAFGTAKSASALVTVVPVNSVKLGFRLAGDFPSLTILGSVGTSYHLEYKTSLQATNWSPLLNVILSSNSYSFTDFGFTNSIRFYRVRSSP